MMASQPTRRRVAAAWRTARRAVAALRAIHDEQVLMWELLLAVQPRLRRSGRATGLAVQPGRAPADRQRPAHPRRRRRRERAMTGTPRPGPRRMLRRWPAPAGRWLELE